LLAICKQEVAGSIPAGSIGGIPVFLRALGARGEEAQTCERGEEAGFVPFCA
jgi:hypothetical protein